MAKGYDVTTPADNRNALLGPACRYWPRSASDNTDGEVKCGMCRMCVKSQKEWTLFAERWQALAKSGL